jgi:hypothetical protein
MAPAASNKPVGLQIALTFFVLATIILLVIWYMQMKSLSETQAKLIESEKQLGNVRKSWTDEQNNVTVLKKMAGANQDTVQSSDPTDVTTSAGYMQAKINEAKPNNGISLIETVDKMLAAYKATDADRSQIRANLNQLQQNFQAQEEHFRAMADEHDKAAKQAKADLQDLIRNKQETLDQKDKEIADLKILNNEKEAEINNLSERLEANNKKYRDEIVRLEGINDKLRDQLDVLKQESFEVADGLVRWVEHSNGMVYINLGSEDKLRERTTFSVYAKDSSGIGRGQQDIKGKIEVVRIIDGHTAACKIVEGSEDLYRPIAQGDQIYSPLWNAGRAEQFSFAGLIDIDGDGRSDRGLLHQIIKTAGAEIDNEIDDEGNRVPSIEDGGGITERTKFLVLGDIPDKSKLTRDEDRERAQKIYVNLTDMHKEARLNGVRTVNLNDFLNYIGYKAKRRLFQPGQERPFNLKAGAHSAGVNEPVVKSNRESSGQVSGSFTRDKNTRQQVSPGNTSETFGPKRGY